MPRHDLRRLLPQRRGWLAVLVLLALACTASAGANAPVTVAPVPHFHYHETVIRFGGKPHLLLQSLELYGIGSLLHHVTCVGCVRLPTKLNISHPTAGATLYKGANWILLPGLSILISVYGIGRVGRYLHLSAHIGSRPGLVFSASGCEAAPGRVEACPRGTAVPVAGSAVPQAPAATVQNSGGSGSVGSGDSGGGSGSGSGNQPQTAGTYALTVSLAGTGSGSVSGNGISCPGTCGESLASGTAVSLTATPASGSTFAGWSGGCTGTGTCNLTIGAAAAVTATFTLVPHQLTVSLGGAGAGTVSGGGISCPGTCGKSYASGTAVSLSAAPAGGSTFAGWGGACSGSGACSVTLGSDQSVSATFTLVPHQLSVGIGGSGSVTGNGISCPGTCSATYASGTTVSLTASPAGGWSFAGWGGACGGTGGCNVTLGSDQSVSATFSQNTHAETVGGVTNTWTNYSNAGGTGGAQIAKGQTVAITCAVPGFRVADGDTWWYRIASSPWNNQFYASADAFYNNGATSGTLSGTPFVDTSVPGC